MTNQDMSTFADIGMKNLASYMPCPEHMAAI